MLKRYTSLNIPPPGTHGIQPGDWVVTQGLSSTAYNGKVAVMVGTIRPQLPDQKSGDRRVAPPEAKII